MDPFPFPLQNVCTDDVQFTFYNPDDHCNLDPLLPFDLDPLLPWSNAIHYSSNGCDKEESDWTNGFLHNGSQGSSNSQPLPLPLYTHAHSEMQSLSHTSSDDHSENNRENVSVEISKGKKRKRSMEKGPMFVFCTRSPTDKLDDGYKWRKYGKKTIKSSPHQRSYYMCLDSNCMVKKRVERDPGDREVVITSYQGKHNHESPCPIPIYCVGNPFILQNSSYTHSILLLNAALSSHNS